MKIIIVNSAKGGVAKTYTAVGLAKSLDGKTAILDMDVTTPNVTNVDGVKVYTFETTKIPTKSSITRFISKVSKQAEGDGIEWLVIDTPPTLSEIYITIAEQVVNASYLFVTTGAEDAIKDTRKGIAFFSMRGAMSIGVVQTMLCAQLGKSFDSMERLGLPTLAKFPLSKEPNVKKFKALAKKIEKLVKVDGTLNTIKLAENIEAIISKEDLEAIPPQSLRFFTYDTWEETKGKIVAWDMRADGLMGCINGNNSHFDVPVEKIKHINELGDSCFVLITKHLSVAGAPRIGTAIEVEITRSNPISKGLPMFLTAGPFLWHTLMQLQPRN